MVDYISRAEFKTRQNITNTSSDDIIDEVITEASRMVDGLCGRRFDDLGSATARVFRPLTAYLAIVDDFSTTTGLVIKTDTSDDGTYNQTWDAADYTLEPLNGVGENGQSGWPYWRICAVKAKTFPLYRRPTLEVTAQWGWAAVPADVKGATYLVANRLFELRSVPFGTVPSVEFGSLPIREQRDVMKLLRDYVRRTPLVA